MQPIMLHGCWGWYLGMRTPVGGVLNQWLPRLPPPRPGIRGPGAFHPGGLASTAPCGTPACVAPQLPAGPCHGRGRSRSRQGRCRGARAAAAAGRCRGRAAGQPVRLAVPTSPGCGWLHRLGCASGGRGAGGVCSGLVCARSHAGVTGHAARRRPPAPCHVLSLAGTDTGGLDVSRFATRFQSMCAWPTALFSCHGEYMYRCVRWVQPRGNVLS